MSIILWLGARRARFTQPVDMEGKLNLRIFEIVLNAVHLILQMQDMQENAGARNHQNENFLMNENIYF